MALSRAAQIFKNSCSVRFSPLVVQCAQRTQVVDQRFLLRVEVSLLSKHCSGRFWFAEMSGVSKMKVAELREALQARGLDTRGTKPFLVSRLENAISKDAAEVEEKGRLKEMKETILAEVAASPSATAPSTPGRRSRRLSGECATLATAGTPVRRRLLDSVTGSPSRIGSPARKTRRVSGGEERPSTPSRRSRRLSGCSADGEEEEVALVATIPDPIEEVEEEEISDEGKADSEVVSKIESEGAEVATELDVKDGEEGVEKVEKEKVSEDPETVKAVAAQELDSNVEEPQDPDDTGSDPQDGGEMQVEQVNVDPVEVDEKQAEGSSAIGQVNQDEDMKDDEEEEGTVEEEHNEREKSIEIECEKNKTDEVNISEGESEKENVLREEKNSDAVSVAEEEVRKDDSFSAAACAVIGSTNELISSLRQEMAARKSLVAPKQIPRQKPKSGKFWKEERSAFR